MVDWQCGRQEAGCCRRASAASGGRLQAHTEFAGGRRRHGLQLQAWARGHAPCGIHLALALPAEGGQAGLQVRPAGGCAVRAGDADVDGEPIGVMRPCVGLGSLS